MENRKLTLFTKRFFPAGNYTWPVPPGCTKVDVFVIGGGGGSYDGSGGGGGYTKTFKKDTTGWRDGESIEVIPGQTISIIVGKGSKDSTGGYSQFMNSSYRANGGHPGSNYSGGNGGSGGDGDTLTYPRGGSDGNDGASTNTGQLHRGYGQGHTTRDFGESTGKRNAGGGAPARFATYDGGPSYALSDAGGDSDYKEGSGTSSNQGNGGGGYGGGAGNGGVGGDGTVLIRYWAYSAE